VSQLLLKLVVSWGDIFKKLVLKEYSLKAASKYTKTKRNKCFLRYCYKEM